MFTGLVERTGVVASLDPREVGARLYVDIPEIAAEITLGDSIAVNGCCLTVTERADTRIAFDLLEETLARTNLGLLSPGKAVNIERALAASARMGGHFVQGHVDCTAAVVSISSSGDTHRLEIAMPPESARHIVFKGSIAVDGVSLTVAEVLANSFVVWIIPHTFARTNLSELESGSPLNLEFDILAKYVERLLASGGAR